VSTERDRVDVYASVAICVRDHHLAAAQDSHASLIPLQGAPSTTSPRRRYAARPLNRERTISAIGVSDPLTAGSDLAQELYDAAVAAALPDVVTTRAVNALPIERDRRIWLFAFGKASHSMAGAAVKSLLRSLHSIVGGVVVGPEAAPPPYPTLISLQGDHPIPGSRSFAAAAKIAEITQGRRSTDVAIVLISGGASSLIGAPLRGMNENDLALLFELLLTSGLDIAATNAVRKRFTRWGAGRLALALAPAATHCLVLSDVVSDDLSIIGSGPCSPDATTVKDVNAILDAAGLMSQIPPTHREFLTAVARGTIPETPTSAHPAFVHVSARVIGNNKSALSGAAAEARRRGIEAQIVETPLQGDAARAGEAVARKLLAMRADGSSGMRTQCVIWGGETTVAVDGVTSHARPGGGGRCQELALAAARTLHAAGPSADGITLLAAGTDGRDGATDAAGACIDGSTWAAILAAGRDPASALATHASYGALSAANALIPQRSTSTNVADVVIGVIS
jgi:glycerate 2-kinase